MNSLSYTQVEEFAQRELTQLEFEGINPYKVYKLFKHYRPYVPVDQSDGKGEGREGRLKGV